MTWSLPTSRISFCTRVPRPPTLVRVLAVENTELILPHHSLSLELYSALHMPGSCSFFKYQFTCNLFGSISWPPCLKWSYISSLSCCPSHLLFPSWLLWHSESLLSCCWLAHWKLTCLVFCCVSNTFDSPDTQSVFNICWKDEWIWFSYDVSSF